MSNEIWTEKYRPRRLSEVVGQEDIVARLRSYARQSTMPHLLFAGPAGVGKTACAGALVREMFPHDWEQNLLELNASDERGIEVVREDIKNFARTSPAGQAAFRTLFLDEADMLTPDAQAALRRTMEQYSANCRFILSVNYSGRILEPIQSRCALYRFRPLPPEAIQKRLRHIAQNEKTQLTDEGMRALLAVAQGDLRRAINALQSAAALDHPIDARAVFETNAEPRPEEVQGMLQAALHGDFLRAREALSGLLDTGICGTDLLRHIHRQALQLEVDEPRRAQLIDRIGETDYRITEGADERLQLEALLAALVVHPAPGPDKSAKKSL
ncbi:MAG: replication factor C small subunit [Euryarchaeota archaeon]|nr:replication factor C small subunit [Euryarchaeota archaeon]